MWREEYRDALDFVVAAVRLPIHARAGFSMLGDALETIGRLDFAQDARALALLSGARRRLAWPDLQARLKREFVLEEVV